MVCGIASIDGISFMFIGHQKGRNTKVRPNLNLISHRSTSGFGTLAHWCFTAILCSVSVASSEESNCGILLSWPDERLIKEFRMLNGYSHWQCQMLVQRGACEVAKKTVGAGGECKWLEWA